MHSITAPTTKTATITSVTTTRTTTKRKTADLDKDSNKKTGNKKVVAKKTKLSPIDEVITPIDESLPKKSLPSRYPMFPLRPCPKGLSFNGSIFKVRDGVASYIHQQEDVGSNDHDIHIVPYEAVVVAVVPIQPSQTSFTFASLPQDIQQRIYALAISDYSSVKTSVYMRTLCKQNLAPKGSQNELLPLLHCLLYNHKMLTSTYRLSYYKECNIAWIGIFVTLLRYSIHSELDKFFKTKMGCLCQDVSLDHDHSFGDIITSCFLTLIEEALKAGIRDVGEIIHEDSPIFDEETYACSNFVTAMQFLNESFISNQSVVFFSLVKKESPTLCKRIKPKSKLQYKLGDILSIKIDDGIHFVS